MAVQAFSSQQRETRRTEPADAPEPQLLELARLGDREAFARLVTLHQDCVLRLAWRLLGWHGDVEDVVQEIFITAMLNLRKFRGDSTFATWLMTLTVNRCRRERRKRTLRWVLWDRWQREVEPASQRPADEPSIAREQSHQVRQAVRNLPSRYREAIVLRYLEEVSIDDIANVLHISRNTLEVRLHRGRQQLRELLAEMMKE